MRKILLTLCAALVAASSYAQWGPVNAVYLQGRMVCSTAPSNGQSLIWNTTYNCWTPTTATGGITASDDVAWTGTHTFSLGATFGASSQLKWGSSGVTSPDVGLERLLTTWLQVTDGSTGMGSLSLKNLNVLRVDDTDFGQIVFGGTVGSEFSNDTYLYRPVAGRIDIGDASGLGALAIDGLSIGATSTLADGKLSMTSVLNDATGNETALSLAYTTNKGTSGDDTGLKIVQTDSASPGTSYLINALVGSSSKFFVDNAGKVQFGAGGYMTSPGSDAIWFYNNSGTIYAATRHAYVQVFDTDTSANEINIGRPSNTIALSSAATVEWTGDANAESNHDVGFSRAAAGVIKVTDASTGAGTITAGGLQTGAYTAVSDGKAIINATMDDATGDEVAVTINSTTNKATSGADTALKIVGTDTASPGTSRLLALWKGAQEMAFDVEATGNGRLLLLNEGAGNNAELSLGSYGYFITESRGQFAWSNAQNTNPGLTTDLGLARAAAGVVKVTDSSTGAGTLTAGGIQTGVYTAVTDGKAIINATLDDATGDEAAITINQTTNKASSGQDTAIKVAFTDTASPATSSFLLDGTRGANREVTIAWDNGSYGPYLETKTFTAAGRASVAAAHTTDSKYINIFANGSGSSGALAAGDTGIFYVGNSSRGVPVLTDQLGGWTYGYLNVAGVALGEAGGSSALDAGVRRSAAGTVQIYNGNSGTPASASLVTAGIDVGGTSTVADGKVSVTSTVNDATGDETAVKIAYTTNKASSGNDTGLEIVQTDTASPGTSYLIDAKVSTTSKFSVTNAGKATAVEFALPVDGNALTFSGASWDTYAAGVRMASAPLFARSTSGFKVGSGAQVSFSSATDDVSVAADAGIARSAAGVLKVTDASTGYGGLSLDTNSVHYADTVSLTDGSDVAFLDIAIADGDMMGGDFAYTITATDTTDFQAISGTVSFAAVRKAGTPSTYVCDIDEHLGTDSTAVSTGTLTDSFTCAGASDKITLTINANSSLTTPTMTMRYNADLHTTKAITKK